MINELFNSWKNVDALLKTTNTGIPDFGITFPSTTIEEHTPEESTPIFKSINTVKKLNFTNSAGKGTPYSQPKVETTVTLSSPTKDFIKKQEGFRESRYADAGRTSIGYGFFGDTYWKDNHITREQADLVLDNIIGELEQILSKFDIWKKLNQNQKTALHSYMYNVGKGKFSEGTKMGDALRSGDLQKIHDAFSIVTSEGKRNEVLVRRRNEEKQLFKS